MNSDKRQIQTAVQGGPESDDPVICPIGAAELEVFREETVGTTFWCGVLLGGCGGQLSTRKPADRACHFFHLPDPQGLLPPCGRRGHSSGVAGADHLYVKSATQSWFHRQGTVPRYRFINHDDAPVGSVVDIDVNGHTLRVHMNKNVPLEWDAENVDELILGPGVPSASLWPLGRRYVNRVRFDSVDGRRIMRVGTETPHGGTEWFDPSECEVTSEGLLMTPAAERVLNAEMALPVVTLESAASAPDAEAKAASVAVDRHVPDEIGNLVRSMDSAVAAGDIASARVLCREAELALGRCQGYALYTLQSTLKKAEEWLAAHTRKRRVLFIRLRTAVQDGNALAARPLVEQVKKRLRRDIAPSDTEAETLVAAESLIVSKLPESRPHRTRAAFAPSTASRLSQPGIDQETPAQTARSEQQHHREDRQARRLARARARSVLGLLKATRLRALPADEEQRLIAELSTAMETAGELLSTRERRDAAQWIDRTPRKQQKVVAAQGGVPSQRGSEDIAEPQLPPEILTRTADAVRRVLERRAREQATTTWADLRQRLGAVLPHMGIADRVEVLVLVDRKTPADRAPLSSLVAIGDPIMTPYYRKVLTALGLVAPTDDDDLRDVLEADVEQVHSYWRHQ